MRRQWTKRDILPRNQLNPQLTQTAYSHPASKSSLTTPQLPSNSSLTTHQLPSNSSLTTLQLPSKSSLTTPQTASYVEAVLVPDHMDGSTEEDSCLDVNPPVSSATVTTVKPSPPLHSPGISAESPPARNAHSSPADESPVPSTPSSSGSTITAGEGAEEEDRKVVSDNTDQKNATKTVPCELIEQSISRLYKTKYVNVCNWDLLSNFKIVVARFTGVFGGITPILW